DHTSGTRAGFQTPAAMAADNDLAFGRILEALSHSRFWKDTCLLAIEDDPQMGWDHVSGYRTTCYVASPYTRRGAVVSTQYNQTNGTRPGFQTPAAMAADNDLAFGRILEALSHSRFWKDTCLLAIEDDPQMGWDHVSGYRTTCYVASPYTRRGAVVSTQYNQT